MQKHCGGAGQYVIKSKQMIFAEVECMYIAVCDDKPEELKSVLNLLAKWQCDSGTPLRYKAFSGASELLDAAKKERFTLYLLDVIMPGIDGISAAREIRMFDTAADIVFLTSSPGFAYESYGVKALDYILKPVSERLLFPILDTLALRESEPRDGITVKSGDTIIHFPFSSLTYVEVNGKHLYFNLTDKTVQEVSGTLKNYEELLLSRSEFVRTHRSYIVNMLQIKELSPSGIITFSEKNVPVSRLLYPSLQKSYMKLLFAERT